MVVGVVAAVEMVAVEVGSIIMAASTTTTTTMAPAATAYNDKYSVTVTVTVSFDGDEAGAAALHSFAALMSSGMAHFVQV